MSTEPLPELKQGSLVQGDGGEDAPSDSMWGTIKGWFS
jgi:hypothetical protein